MISNDIAAIIQTTDTVHLVLKDPCKLKGLSLTQEEELCILALYSSYIREKLKGDTK